MLKFATFLVAVSIVQAINWQDASDASWAMQCDFPGRDLRNARTRGQDCTSTCKSTPGCTHFSWNNHNGGTCWMKTGGANKGQAVRNNDPTSVCGIVKSGGGGGNHDHGLGSNSGETIGVQFRKGRLVWADEFDSNERFKQNWFYETGGHGWGNNELQYYTNNGNAYLSNSFLTIEAKRQQYGGKGYTSARLKTHRTFTYGAFEMRAKVPRGRGTWPAFWLLSRKQPFKWPDNGEIDILEHVGYDMGRVHANIHTKKYNHMIGTNKGKSTFVNNIDTEFHLYQLEWRPDRISAFIDGREYFTYRKTESSFDAWPFDHGFEIILNVAVGGNWGGQKGIDDSAFPARYVVDYVRVYDLA